MSYTDGLLRSNGAWGYTAETPELFDRQTLAPIANKIVAKSLTTVTYVSSVAENNLVSLAIPTTVVAGDVLRLTAGGTQINSSAGAVDYTAKLTLDDTNILSTGAISLTNNANARKWKLICDIAVIATNSQRIDAALLCSATGSSTWTPLNTTFSFVGTGTAVEDLTSAKNILFTMQMGTSDASAGITCHYAYLVLNRQY